MPVKLYNTHMKPDSFSRIFAFACLLVVLPFACAWAQGEHSVPLATNTETNKVNQSLPPEPDSDVTILRDDFAGKYHPSTLEYLSKMYWRLGTFDMEDSEAVANYVKITECKLFTEYVNDDMEWKQIVETMRQHIEKTRSTYPLNFQFVLQLRLGRYDPEQGGFPIVDRTGFNNAKRIEVDSIDKQQSICYDNHPIKDYPTQLIILLTQPFSLDFLKLDEHVAQAYILRKKSEYSSMADRERVSRYERDAYLRLRVTFSQYHGNVPKAGGQPMAILQGNIDGYEIFEDAKQKRMMLSVNLEDQAAAQAPAMSVPVAPAAKVVAVPQEPVDPSKIEVEAAPGFAATPSP
jgi:hypothetical protein